MAGDDGAMDLIKLGLDPPHKKTRNEVCLEEMNQVALNQLDARATSGGRALALCRGDDAAHPQLAVEAGPE